MKRHSIHYNFIMNFILTASSILFPLITFPYVSRILLPEGTGKVAFATSMVSYFTMIAMLGVPTYGIRAVARVREDKEKLSAVVHELLIINFIMTLIAYFFFFVTMAIVPQMQALKPLMLVCSSAILLNSFGVSWFYQGVEDYTYITWVSLLFKLVSIITMVLFVRSPSDYIWYGVMTVLSSYGSGLVNFLRLPRYISRHPLAKLDLKRHLGPVMVFFAMSVATTIYTNLDTVMLGMMKNDYEVGLYNSGIKIKTLLVSLITSLGTVLLPRLSAYVQEGKMEEFKRIISRALSFVLLFSLPVCLFCMVYSRQILLFLCGAAYVPASACMIVLMPTITLIGLSNITGIQVLVPTGREKGVLLSVSAGALLDLLLNLALIPLWGAAGAAAGTLCAEALVLLVQAALMPDFLRSVLPRVEWKPLLLSLAACVPGILIRGWLESLPVLISLIAAGIVFFGLDFAVLCACREENAMVLVQFLTRRVYNKN